jgi:tetratricopeptide (TPR) repeat protein
LEPTAAVGISAAELYSQAGRHDEVVAMTEGVANEDDASAFLLVLRGVAFRELGHLNAAKETLTAALRSRSRASEIRHRALIERAQVHLDAGKKAIARRDLERILAEDSAYPGLREALNGLDRADSTG